MKISIIGAGNIGGNLARLLVKSGNDVAITNSRGPATLKNLANELGSKLHTVTPEEAVAYSDVIVLSIPWRAIDSLATYKVPGKIIVDTTNPYKEDGTTYNLGIDISSSKAIAHFPGAAVVKAFNTIWFKHLAENGNTSLPLSERRVIPVAGDNAKAKEKIGRIIEEIGFGPLDTGSLKEGSKLQEVQGILYNKELKLKEAVSLIKGLK
jgi:8-hydroxy-5-deazaflavin:NADPH oxidoreductase